MRRCLSIVLFFSLFSCTHERAVVPLPESGASTEAWSFIDRAVGERRFVLLGESIHLTAEFPRARLPIVRRLHEERGFDVIAFEGSMIDSWVAADDLLRAPELGDPRAAAGTAWLDIWQTPDMLEVMKYIVSTKNSARPLYLASMDIQPGLGDSAKKNQMIETFAARVFEYAGRAGDPKTIGAALETTRRCDFNHETDETRTAAASTLEAAIKEADAKVRALSPMHADTLALIPGMLRQRFAHCVAFMKSGEPDFHVYKEERDRFQAENVIAFQEKVSKTGRVMVWAHHSHTAYLGTTRERSIGGELKTLRPGQVYSLGVYGSSGRCKILQDGAGDGSVIIVDLPTWDGDPKYSGMVALRDVGPAPSGYFLDFARAKNDPRLSFISTEHGYFSEFGPIKLVLDREHDGLILLPKISETKMEPM